LDCAASFGRRDMSANFPVPAEDAVKWAHDEVVKAYA
jgi:hypothetical protein